MKNITVLNEPDDIHGFVRKLWKTPEFQASHDDPQGFVHGIVDKFAAWPRFAFERSDDKIEPRHFSAWWGGLQLRPHDYDNDAVHDLYILHEIYHTAAMPCLPVAESDMQRGAFLQKIANNESDASVISEIAVYFALPTLRAKSFPFEIYADRFLKDPVMQALWRDHRDEFMDTMKFARRNVMSPQYQPKDLPEQWLHSFAAQNKESGPVWDSSFRKIEAALWKLRRECVEIGRAPAMKNFMDWLTSPEITKGTSIPFPEEAAIFAATHARGKEQAKAEAEAFKRTRPPAPALPFPKP